MDRLGLADLRYRDYWLFLASTFTSELGMQMQVVAIGWQVYAISGDALDLGLIGLCEFLPLLLLALPAGQLADRLPRRVVFAASLALNLAVTGLLIAVS